jgi:hypothetical protein
MTTTLVEQISWDGKLLALIVRAEMLPEKTTFLTPLDLNLQLGFVVYPSGGEVARHVHPTFGTAYYRDFRGPGDKKRAMQGRYL